MAIIRANVTGTLGRATVVATQADLADLDMFMLAVACTLTVFEVSISKSRSYCLQALTISILNYFAFFNQLFNEFLQFWLNMIIEFICCNLICNFECLF